MSRKSKKSYFDCDADTILLKVNQIGGAACHEGYKSCFFRRIDNETVTVVGSGFSIRNRFIRNSLCSGIRQNSG